MYKQFAFTKSAITAESFLKGGDKLLKATWGKLFLEKVFPDFLPLYHSSSLSAPFAGAPQQFLYFLPLPHGHGSFLPTFSPLLTVGFFT